MFRTSILAASLCFVGCASHSQTTAATPAQSFSYSSPLNVIVVSMDALRYDRTGLGSSPTRNTPNLDRLAQESVVFHQAVSAASWTVPSHMSMWTARWPTQHGMTNKFRRDPHTGRDEEARLAPELTTYPELLARAGWTSVAFTGGAGVSARFGFGRGFSHYLDDRRFAGMDYSLPPALAWIRAHQQERFFLFLHGYDVHGQHEVDGVNPRAVSPNYQGPLDGSITENARLREQGLSRIQGPGQHASLSNVLTAEDGLFLRSLYDRKVQQADARLGAFLSELRELGLLDRSILAVVSDHGDEFLEHGGFDHGHTLYEEQLHVVMMLRFPGGSPHRDVRVPVRTIDLFPTLFDVLQLRGPSGINGESLLPLLRAGSEPEPRPVFAESDYRRFVHHRMVRHGRYKLLLDMGDNELRLYDLERDPQELRDLSTSEPEVRTRMEGLLDAWLRASGTDRRTYLGVREEYITVF